MLFFLVLFILFLVVNVKGVEKFLLVVFRFILILILISLFNILVLLKVDVICMG